MFVSLYVFSASNTVVLYLTKFIERTSKTWRNLHSLNVPHLYDIQPEQILFGPWRSNIRATII